MGKPKHYWYGVVRKMVMNSNDHKSDESYQMYLYSKAMEEANKETLKLPDGELRLKAVELILIKKTQTFESTAQELHYDARTIQRWINSYINLVGRKAGF